MKLKIKVIIIALSFWVLLTGCEEKGMTADDVEKLIQNNLRVGDSSAAIEAFLDNQKIAHSYDDFNKRYQCIIRDPSPKYPKGRHSIVIHIYVDKNKNYERVEVRNSFTAV